MTFRKLNMSDGKFNMTFRKCIMTYKMYLSYLKYYSIIINTKINIRG